LKYLKRRLQKWKCQTIFGRKIELIVITCGLIPYLQAVYIGIFKGFKDKILALISDLKHSSLIDDTGKWGFKTPESMGL